ncbi:hypothetical protein HXX76_004866 [Chlamydomonas incerta]|uniref:Uncharacterized protein n=1 Tax=Chlamydomonas incerta TaxID=51695 RepID=A0A835W6U7_CHLIN|nr:hypothetical protein HXX76_004866 [Chlamydomonas incerta]|eukprot:KAG2439513.1 hypothetical protein HXX76_004866 [Chlamydomonas incerta]
MMLKRSAPASENAWPAQKAKSGNIQLDERRTESRARTEEPAASAMSLDHIVRSIDLESQRAFVGALPSEDAVRAPDRHRDWWHVALPGRVTSALTFAASKWRHLSHIRLDLHAASLAPPDDTPPAAAAAAADPLGPLNGRHSVSACYAAAFAAAAAAGVRLPGVTSLQLRVSSAELWALAAAEAAAAALGERGGWPVLPIDADEAAAAALRRRAAAALVLSPALAAALAALFPCLAELSLVGPWASPDKTAAAAFAALSPAALPALTRLRLPVRVAASRHLRLLTATRALTISGEDLRPLPALAAAMARVSVGGEAGADAGRPTTRTQLALQALTCLQELTLSHVCVQRLLEGPAAELPAGLQRIRLVQASFLLPPDVPAAADAAAAALLRSAAAAELHVHHLLLDWPALLLSVAVLQPKTAAATAAAALDAGTGVLRLGSGAGGSSSSASRRTRFGRGFGRRGGLSGFGDFGPGWEPSAPLDVPQLAALVRALAAPLGLDVLHVDAVDVTGRQRSQHSLTDAAAAAVAAAGGGGGGAAAVPVLERAWRVLEAFAAGGPDAALALAPPPPPRQQQQQQQAQELWAAPVVAPAAVAGPLPPVLPPAAFAHPDGDRRRLHRLGSDDLDGKARRLLRLLCGAAQLLGRSGAVGGGSSGGGGLSRRAADATAAAAAARATTPAPAPAAVFPVWLARPPAVLSGAAPTAAAAAHTAKLCEAVPAALPRLLRLLPRGWFLYVGHSCERELARCLQSAAAAAAAAVGDDASRDSHLRYSGAVWMAVLPECRPRGVCVDGVFAGRLRCVGEGQWGGEGSAGAVPSPPAGPQPPPEQPEQLVPMLPGALAAFAAAAWVAEEDEEGAELEEAAAVAAVGPHVADMDLSAAFDLEFPVGAMPGGGLAGDQEGDEVWGAAGPGHDGGGDDVIGGPLDLMELDG